MGRCIIKQMVTLKNDHQILRGNMVNLLLQSTNANKKQSTIVIKASSLNALLDYLDKPSDGYDQAFKKLLSLYRIERRFPDMSHFRLGPNMFENIPLYLIVLADNHLIAHGLMTDIYWDSSMDLPNGWQGAVRNSHEQLLENTKKNTLVGLYIRVESSSKKQGNAEKIINTMKTLAQEQHFDSLIIPLRLPKRFMKQYAKLPYKKFIALTGKEGEPLDHWLRLHTRLGATILGTNLTSHQHAMNLDDFTKQFTTKKIRRSGYYLSEKQGLFYNAYIDVKRHFALINQECTWVEHNLCLA